MADRLLKVFSIFSAIAVLGSVFIISISQENKVKAAGEQIVIASLPADSTDKGVTYSRRLLMKDYPKEYWAKRSPRVDTKSARGDDYTEMQILPDTRSLISQCNQNLPNQVGSGFKDAGTLADRFQAGGPGEFIDRYDFGGWTSQSFDPVANGWDKTLTKTASYKKGDYLGSPEKYLSAHWEDFLFGLDQIGSYGTHYNNYPDTGFSSTSCTYNGVKADNLIGGETILFVRKFNLTDEQYKNIEGFRFEALTDDFSKVWINGNPIGEASESYFDLTESPEFRLHPAYGRVNKLSDEGDDWREQKYLVPGENSIAIQITNRMHWEIVRSSDSAADKAYRINKVEMENPVALYFRLFMDLKTPPPPTETSPSCSVEPQTGLTPLVVKVTAIDGTAPYDYDMGDGTVLQNRETPIYYTYGEGGTKKITINDSNNKKIECSPITVKDPTDSSGGEVAP